MVDAVAEAYERKRTETGEEGIAVLERVVLLRVIDSLWVEHLTAVDDMRRGIGLRAYSQRDPLNEFKVEAYRMFDELKDTIRHDVTHTIFRVSVAREPAAQPTPSGDGRSPRPDRRCRRRAFRRAGSRGRVSRKRQWGWSRRHAAAGARRPEGRAQ